jgi:hypothetical protein
LLNRRVCDSASQQPLRWKGHRTWYADGSSFSMPDTPALQKHFGQPGQQKPGCGFPVAHLLCLFEAESGLLREVVASPLRTHDLSQMPQVHQQLCANDVLIADTAFGSYFHLAGLQASGVFGVFPVHQARIVNFCPGREHLQPGARRYERCSKDRQSIPTSRWVQKLGKDDQLVEYFKPAQCPAWMTRAQYQAAPQSIIVREIRRSVYRKGFRPMTIVVVTTLLDPATYPADQIIQLLKGRWSVETNLRHLKTTMKMEIFRCKSVEAVHKELSMFVLIYNLVRLIMLEAAARQNVAVERISFADALYWMRHGNIQGSMHGPMPNLTVNPLRPDRIEPRAIKRRPKEYDRLNKPRAEMRRALKKQR